MLDLLELKELLSSEILRFVSMIHLGFAAALVLTVLGMVLCCAVEWFRDKRTTHRRIVACLLVIGYAAVVGASEVSAQEAQEVPTIEPTFTRIFGSDSLTIDAVTRISPKVSISPNGKWIVFSTAGGAALGMTLWIAPAAGGEAVRLLDGDYIDHQPIWFPSGDRILFRSTRASTPERLAAYLMTVPIDPETGIPTGPPRQVTIEPTPQYGFSVSPDGKSIAYVTHVNRGQEGVSLKILPATGGAARTVARHARVYNSVWSEDGQSLYYLARQTETANWAAMQVSAEGGTPQTLSTSSVPFYISPDAKYICRMIATAWRQPKIYEIATIRGQPLARITLPKTMAVDGFTPDGQGLLAVMINTVAPLRVLPVNGGPTRQLTETRANDVALGWTPDGEQIFFATELNGEEVFMLAPRDGGPMRQVRLPGRRFGKFMPVLSMDGRHVLHSTVVEGTDTPVLKIVDLESGSSREVTRSNWRRYRTFDVTDDGESFVYAEKLEDRFEFRTVRPDGPSVLLRTFPGEDFPPLVGVHGDRIAYTEEDGDSTSLFIARAGEEARRVLTVAGMLSARGSASPTWSPDGRRLALAYSAVGAEDNDVMLVEVTPADEVVGEPRILNLEPGPKWWGGVQWLPDGNGFVIVGMGAETLSGSRLWLVSLDAGARPIALTRDDPYDVWSFSLSPDGRYVAYSSDKLQGSSVWQVDLGDVLTGGR